jgi:hypothetical protein
LNYEEEEGSGNDLEIPQLIVVVDIEVNLSNDKE